MTGRGDDRLREARALPIRQVAEKLQFWPMLKQVTPEEWAGPCPGCLDGKDRFSINTRLGLFNCRVCAEGGDVIALVQFVESCTFPAALDFLVGEAEPRPDPVKSAQRRAKAEAHEARQAEIAAERRARAIRDAREVWHAAQGQDLDLVRAYLAGRGIRFDAWPPTLRALPDHPYRRQIGGTWRELHRGPCLVAAVQDAQGQVRAVHQTWIDPARPGAKAEIQGPEGAMPAKLVRGSKKGGAIRLSPLGDARVMVMGEGIETTASALVANPLPGAVYWAGVDLGNMGGRQVRVPGQRHSGRPDLSDRDAWIPPAQIEALTFLQDGDSDPAATRAKLTAGLRRAMARRPGLVGTIVAAPAGRDFNDVLRGEGPPRDDDTTTE